ncbi:MAG: hypothetical protein AAF215_13230 [Cyanobacteria bacterium P01_A01_bin.123]
MRSSRQIGKVVKSNSHCDYVVQLDDEFDVAQPPTPEDYGFGQFVKFADRDRHWAVGIVYNSLLLNPQFLNNGPRLSSEPDPMFTPDLINETRTLLGVALVGSLVQSATADPATAETGDQPGLTYGRHGIPKVVVPVNTGVYQMSQAEVYRFHLNAQGQPQFCYYSHLLRSGGMFAAQLIQQVLAELIDAQLFSGDDQRALEVLCKELSWKNTMSAIRG